MTQRLSAEPGAAAAVAADPAPSVALRRHATGPQAVTGNTGAEVIRPHGFPLPAPISAA